MSQQGYSLIPGVDVDDTHSPSDSQSEDGTSYRPQRSEEDLSWHIKTNTMSDDTAPLRTSTHEEEKSPPPTPATATRGAKIKRCFCILATIFFILLLAAAIVILALLLIFVGQQPARVHTDLGIVEGSFDPINKIFSFKGIPFASPPTGKLRWQPPRNHTPWEGIYKAETYPDKCFQYGVHSKEISGSEDCLYLNVFTPAVDVHEPLPVMVYIHGGYLQWGEGYMPGYTPDEKVTARSKVVMVSIQYRLNAFGFLVSEALPGRRGNYGFLDQVQALMWVRNNIRGFGGDPNQVTIFGQSSGGTSVWAHLMSPMSKGLFHRAWIISGSPVYNKTTQDAMRDNAWVLNKLKGHCPNDTVTAQCMETLSADIIVQAMYPEWDILEDSMDLPAKNVFEPALCVVDGEFMPAAPFEMWANKNYSDAYSDVPVIVGTTAQEIDFAPTPGTDLHSWTKNDLNHYVRTRLEQFGESILNQTLALYPWQKSAEYVFTNMASDVRMNCGNDLMTKNAAEALKSPVYRYVATAAPSRTVYPFGMDFGSNYAFHTWDSYAFFDLGSLFTRGGIADSDNDFANTLQTEVMNFVRNGTPNDARWFPFPNTTALIGSTMSYTAAYHKEECDFWLDNGFFSYSWIN